VLTLYLYEYKTINSLSTSTMELVHQPTKHRVNRQTSSASTKKFFAIRKCDTLAAPAIFWNWEDCKFYIDSKENEAVEYRVCGGLKQAVEYIVGDDHDLEPDDAKPRRRGSPTDKSSSKKKSSRSYSTSSLEGRAAQQLVTMTSTTAKRPRTSNETKDFPSPIVRLAERPNNSSSPLSTAPSSLAIMRFNYISPRKTCNFTVKAPIAPALNRIPAPATKVPNHELSYTFGKWMISVNERIAEALSKTMIEYQRQRKQPGRRQQRLSFEDSDVPQLKPLPKHTCRFILKPKNPVAQDSDLRDLFPVVLYDMLADAQAYELDSIIHWLPSGQNFRIDNPSWLVQHVLPIYFDKHITTYNDFLEQLTRWGFEGGAGVCKYKEDFDELSIAMPVVCPSRIQFFVHSLSLFSVFHSDFVKNDRNISWRIVQEGPRGLGDHAIGENSIPFIHLCDSDGEDSDEEDSVEVASLAASEEEADASAVFVEEGDRPFIKPSPPKRKQGTASSKHTTEEQHRWSPAPDNRRGWIPAASPPAQVDYSKIPMEWFPSMLFSVLEDAARFPTRGQIISWNPDGRSFSIWKPRPFKSDVLGPYFGNLDYAEFHDQLRLWGFQSVQPSVPGQSIKCTYILS
jgi:hypothetical protein